MHEPFHVFHARRRLERDTAIPAVDAPAMTVRLRRRHRLFHVPTPKLTLGVATVLTCLIERLSA